MLIKLYKEDPEKYDSLTETLEREKISTSFKNGPIYKVQKLLFENEGDELDADVD